MIPAPQARAEDDRLILEVPVGEMDPWEALRANGDLEGARLVAAGRIETALCLRSEVLSAPTAPPHEGLTLATRALEVGLTTIAVHERSGLPTDGEKALQTDDQAPADAALAALRDHLDAAGWPVREEEAGDLTIDLTVPGSSRRATVRAGASETLRVSTPVLRGPIEAELNRRAVARFLLAAVRCYRRVRPTAWADGTLHLAVDVSPRATGRELDEPLGALALAGRDLRRTAELLATSEEAATEYTAFLNDPEALNDPAITAVNP